MANKFLQGLAITFGGGLAFGAGLKLGQSTIRPTDSGQFTALTGRLDAMEHRVKKVELAPPPVSCQGPPLEGIDPQVVERSISVLESKLAERIESMSGEIRQVETRLGAELEAGAGQVNGLNRRLDEIQARLRSEIEAGDRRAQQQIEGFAGEMKRLEAELPGHVEAALTPRIQALNDKFGKDLEQAQARTLDALVETIENKVVRRMSDLETSLAGQSEVIGGLRDKSLRTDQNMQKLLLAVEKLCDQTERQMARRVEHPAERAGHGSGPPPAEDRDAVLAVEAPPRQPESQVEPEPAPEPPAEIAPALAAIETPEPEVPESIAGPEPVPFPSPVVETPVAAADVPAVAAVEALPEAEPEPLLEDLDTDLEPVAVEAAPVVPPEKIEPSGRFENILSPDGRTVAIPVPPSRRQETRPAAQADADDAAALDLFAPAPKPRRKWRLPLAFSMLTIAGGLSALQLVGMFDSAKGSSHAAPPQVPLTTEPAPGSISEAEMQKLLDQAAANPSDQATLLALGRAYSLKKEWSRAEQVFRSAVAADGHSKDAILGLSDALFQQQKFEESSAILAKLGSIR
jgi:hypothetical protein